MIVSFLAMPENHANSDLWSKILSLDNKYKKMPFCFVLFSLIRISDIGSKILSIDNKNKKLLFCFVLFSLIRIFAVEKTNS